MAAQNIRLRMRDLVPLYGLVKDVCEHKEMYLKPLEKLPENFAADLSLKLSVLYFYNFGVLVGLTDGLRKIIGC